jgi:hypothetical protein
MNDDNVDIKGNKPCFVELMWALIDRKAQQISGKKLEPFEEHVINFIESIRNEARKQTLEEVLKRLLKIPTKDWEIDRDYIVKEIKWLEQKLKEAGKST